MRWAVYLLLVAWAVSLSALAAQQGTSTQEER